MFLHLSVSHSVHGGVGGVCPSACWDTPPWVDTPAGQTPPGQTPGYCSEWYTSYWNVYCSERYASYWNAFLLLPTNEVAGR